MNDGRRTATVVLIVLDGWGCREADGSNAIALAETPNFDRLRKSFPSSTLRASGTAVGLPEGQIGNSEVGHLTLGAGRVVEGELPRINAAIRSGEFDRNPALLRFARGVRDENGVAHVVALASDGGVHSHLDHLCHALDLLANHGTAACLHLVLDARDVMPGSAARHVESILAPRTGRAGLTVGTVSGRYFAMDRDRRWDRTERAWRAIALAEGESATDPVSVARQQSMSGGSEEFAPPTVIGDYAGFRPGDGLLVLNFRADRTRQLLSAIADPDFSQFDTSAACRLTRFAALAPLSESLDERFDILFPAEPPRTTLGRCVSGAGRSQLRLAETEKYPHVTYFFNGGIEKADPGEDRILVPSPKVATYDLAPEMSAHKVGDHLVRAITEARHDLVVTNFANPDMVGHTGSIEATRLAVEAVDRELGRALAALAASNCQALVTADHGNAETMRDSETGAPHTAHTTNPVPVSAVGLAPGQRIREMPDADLADVAPTLLAMMGLDAPSEMSGRSLISLPG